MDLYELSNDEIKKLTENKDWLNVYPIHETEGKKVNDLCMINMRWLPEFSNTLLGRRTNSFLEDTCLAMFERIMKTIPDAKKKRRIAGHGVERDPTRHMFSSRFRGKIGLDDFGFYCNIELYPQIENTEIKGKWVRDTPAQEFEAPTVHFKTEKEELKGIAFRYYITIEYQREQDFEPIFKIAKVYFQRLLALGFEPEMLRMYDIKAEKETLLFDLKSKTNLLVIA